MFPQGWEVALDRNLSFVVNRMNERVLAGQSIETLLAVLMFVLMGITLERSKIANDLLLTHGAGLRPPAGRLGGIHCGCGRVPCRLDRDRRCDRGDDGPSGLADDAAQQLLAGTGDRGYRGVGNAWADHSAVHRDCASGHLAGDLYSAAQEERAQLAGCSDALTYLGEPAVVSVGTLFQAALLPGIMLAVLYALYAFGFALLNPSKAPAVELGTTNSEVITRGESLTWFLGVPAALIGGLILLSSAGVIGSQNVPSTASRKQAKPRASHQRVA